MTEAAARLRAPALLTVLLAGVATLGPFSVDTYLPAFPAIEAELGATPLQMQQTIAAYLVGFGVMMLFHGALSDALGRRPVILGGLALFVLASVGCALASSIETLLAMRVVQGVSAGGGIVVGRAIVRDAHAGDDAQRVLSHVMLIFGIAPALAPVLGGLLVTSFGWQSIFWFLAAFGVLLLVLCAARLPETHPPPARQRFGVMTLLRSYRSIAGHPRYVLLVLAVAFNFVGYFLYVVAAPVIVYTHLGLGATDFAWLLVPGTAGLMLGAWLSGRAAGRIPPLRAVGLGYAIMSCACLYNLALHALVPPGLPWSVLVHMFYAVGMALAMPSATLLALDYFPRARGAAASVQGCTQSLVCAAGAVLLVPLLGGAMLHLAYGMTAAMLAGALCWLAYLRLARRGRRAPARPGP